MSPEERETYMTDIIDADYDVVSEAPAIDLSEDVAAQIKASHQWYKRPSDERFTSLPTMKAHFDDLRERSFERVQIARTLEVSPIDDPLHPRDHKQLAVLDRHGEPMAPTHHAFGQLSSLVKAPAGYLRTLPAALAADNLNYGLLTRGSEEVGLYARRAEGEVTTLRAATGPKYGRVFNADVLAAVIERFGDGVTGDFRVPGEFGKELTAVTKANTSLFAGDRDMFIFLTDERNKIEVPNRRDGQPGLMARGFYIWNSEVGACTLGVATFLFDFICRNRTVWGMDEYKELRIRHTSGAPQRFIEEIEPALLAYSQSSTADLTATIAAAQEAKIEEDLTDFLQNRKFSRARAQAIQAVHIAEEGRPIETVWDASVAITAYAKSIPHQDERVEIERVGGKVLKLAA